MERSLQRDLTWGLALGALTGLASVAASRPQALAVALPILFLALAVWLVAGPTRWVLAFLTAAVLLPPLPFSWGDAAPHPAIAVAAVGVFAGAARLPAWRVRWDFLSAALGVFFFALLWSVPLSALYSGWGIGLGSLARVGLFAISVYMFFYLAHGPGRDLSPERLVRLLFWTGFASTAFACLDFYFQIPAPARFAPQFVWLSSGVFRRAQGVFYEATTLGSFCVFLLVMIASMAVLRRPVRIGAAWLAAGGLVAVTALVLSFSRSAMASLFVALAALGWLERKRLRAVVKLTRGMVVVIGFLLAGAILLSRLFPQFLAIYLERVGSTAEYLVAAPGLVLAPRLESWRFLFHAMAEDPWRIIFGIGYKTLPYSDVLGRPVVADNMYLSLLVETGWIGFAALLLLNAAVLVTSYRLSRDSGFRRLFGVWMFCFWCGQIVLMMSGDVLTYWRLLPLYFSVLAVGARADEDSFSGSI